MYLAKVRWTCPPRGNASLFKPALAKYRQTGFTSSGVTRNSGAPAHISKYSPPHLTKGPPIQLPSSLSSSLWLSFASYFPLPPYHSPVNGQVVQPTSTFYVAAHLEVGPTGPPGKCQAAQSAAGDAPVPLKTNILCLVPSTSAPHVKSVPPRSVFCIRACVNIPPRLPYPLLTIFSFLLNSEPLIQDIPPNNMLEFRGQPRRTVL